MCTVRTLIESFPTVFWRRAFCILLLTVVSAGIAIAESESEGPASGDAKDSNLVDSLKGGKLSVNLRYRFEYVTDDKPSLNGNDARASTLRTALSYRSKPFRGFGGFVEFENVSVLGENTFNNKGAGPRFNGTDNRPVVADVKLTELNQVYFDMTAIQDTSIQAGRKELILDNSRFIGNVGWRQNHQSFDAVSVVNRTIPQTTVTYAHLFEVHNIFAGSKSMRSNLLNAAVQISDSAKLTAYAYMLDFENPADFGTSSNTFGFRLSGTQNVQSDWSLLYNAEYAKQFDGGNNPGELDADYYRLEAGAQMNGSATFKAGYEVLEGSPTEGQFNTPLATLHAFNGWADKFLSTPTNGLKDIYVSLGGNYQKIGMEGIFHWFRSDTGGIGYGKEVDLLFTYRSQWKQLFGFKAAFYRADLYSDDTNKIMLFTAYNF